MMSMWEKYSWTTKLRGMWNYTHIDSCTQWDESKYVNLGQSSVMNSLENCVRPVVMHHQLDGLESV